MIASLLWIAAANALLELVLYPFWLHPIALDGGTIPMSFWAIAYLPLGAACLYAGLRAPRARDAIFIGLAAGVIAQITKAILAAIGYPGHQASLAAIATSEFYTVHFARMTFGFIALLVVAHYATRRLGRGSEG